MTEYICKETEENGKITLRLTIGVEVTIEEFWKLIEVYNKDKVPEPLLKILSERRAWLGLPADWSISCVSCGIDLEEVDEHDTRVKNHFIVRGEEQ